MRFFITTLLLLLATAHAQTLPDVKWELAAWPATDQFGVPAPQDMTGEDWFYSVAPALDASGNTVGIVGAGYTTDRVANPNTTVPPGRCVRNNGGATIARMSLDGEVEWYRYGNREGTYWKVISISDGGFIALGNTKDWKGLTYNPGPNQTDHLNCPPVEAARTATVTRYSANGTMIWERAYGLLDRPNEYTATSSKTRNFGQDRFWDVVEMPNGNFRLVGCLIEDETGNSRASVVDIDSDGNVVGKRVYGDPGKRSMFMGIARRGNSYAIVGTQYTGPNDQNPSANSPFGDVFVNVLSGLTTPPAAYEHTLMSSPNSQDAGYDIAYGSGDQIFVAAVINCTNAGGNQPGKQCGRFGTDGGEGEGVVFRLSSTLVPQGQTSLGDVKAFDLMVGITSTQDGGVAAVSTRQTIPSPLPQDQTYYDETDAFVTKVNSSGGVQWAFTYDAQSTRPQFDDLSRTTSRVKNQECVYQIEELPGGDLIIGGNNSSNFDDSYVVRFGPSTNQTVPSVTVANSHLVYSATNALTVGSGVDVSASTDQTGRMSLLAGSSVVWAGSFTAATQSTLVAQTDPGYGAVTSAATGGSSSAPPPVASLKSATEPFALNGVFPNPSPGAVRIAYTSNGETSVALHLYDALGREVLTETDVNVAPGSAAFDLNGASLATGVYVYRLVSGDRSLSGSLSIAR